MLGNGFWCVSGFHKVTKWPVLLRSSAPSATATGQSRWARKARGEVQPTPREENYLKHEETRFGEQGIAKPGCRAVWSSGWCKRKITSVPQLNKIRTNQFYIPQNAPRAPESKAKYILTNTRKTIAITPMYVACVHRLLSPIHLVDLHLKERTVLIWQNDGLKQDVTLNKCRGEKIKMHTEETTCMKHIPLPKKNIKG